MILDCPMNCIHWMQILTLKVPHSLSLSDETEPQLCKIDLADLEFMEAIGVGGFGEVWKGQWKSTNKIVAIKKVTELEKQLKREASLYGQVCMLVSKCVL